MISKKTSLALLLTVTVLLIATGLLLKPIPQPWSYHNFADQRSEFEVTNAWNVLSNIPLALVGLWGLFLLLAPSKIQFVNKHERWPWVGVSIGLILVAIGSGYYHMAPDHSRLVWDRLPMTIIFMSFAAALITERINVQFGLWLWHILLVIGFSSVFLWKITELRGIGDLRFYLGLQVWTLAVAIIMLLTPSPYNRTWDLAIVAVFYGLAVLCEKLDLQIYQLTDGIISGHTLKHLSAAIGAAWLIRMLWKRKIRVLNQR